MTEAQLTALINGSVDGSLDQAQLAELNGLLRGDAEQQRLHDEIVAVSRALDTLQPEALPAGLAAAVMSRAEAAGVLPQRTGAAPPPGILMTDRREYANRTHSEEDISMRAQNKSVHRKLAIAAGFVCAVGGIGYIASQYAPTSTSHEAAGTIAPAKRFQNNQVSAESIGTADAGTAGGDGSSDLNSRASSLEKNMSRAAEEGLIVAGGDTQATNHGR